MTLKLMRIALITTIFLTPNICFAQGVGQLVNTLTEIEGQLSDFLKLKEYASEVEKAVENNKKPPLPPTSIAGGQAIETRLNKILREIEGISLAPASNIKTHGPSIEDLSSTDLKRRQKAVSIALTALGKDSKEVQNLITVIKKLQRIEQRADRVKKALATLEKSLGQNLKWSGPFYNLVGFAMLDVMKFGRLVADIRRASQKKKKTLNEQFKREKRGLGNYAKNLSLITKSVEEEVKKESLRIDGELANVKNRVKESIIEKDKILSERSKLKSQSDKIKENEGNLRKTLDSIKRKINSYNKAYGDYQRCRKALKSMSYRGCPNKKSFNKCNHQKQKNKYANQYNAKVGDCNRYASRAKSLANQLKTEEAKYKSRLNQHNKRVEQLNREWKSLLQRQKDFVTLQDKLGEDSRKLISDKWALKFVEYQNAKHVKSCESLFKKVTSMK